MSENTNATPAPDAPAPPPKKKGISRFVTPALALVAALAVGGVGGVLIGQNTVSASPARPGGATGQGFGGGAAGGGQGGAGGAAGGGAPGGGFTAGTITGISDGTITIQLADGTSLTVSTTADTTVRVTTEADLTSLATGDEITVIGQKDASGDLAATAISEGAGGPGGGFPGRQGTPPATGAAG
jgi:hypothetical protein